jgi:hypothetical protein
MDPCPGTNVQRETLFICRCGACGRADGPFEEDTEKVDEINELCEADPEFGKRAYTLLAVIRFVERWPAFLRGEEGLECDVEVAKLVLDRMRDILGHILEEGVDFSPEEIIDAFLESQLSGKKLPAI